MSKVLFTYKQGRQRTMRRRDAELLRRLGQGTYMTRDMRADVRVAVEPVHADTPVITDSEADAIDLDALDIEELHALAKERGVKVHHKAGAEKVRVALREAQE